MALAPRGQEFLLEVGQEEQVFKGIGSLSNHQGCGRRGVAVSGCFCTN